MDDATDDAIPAVVLQCGGRERQVVPGDRAMARAAATVEQHVRLVAQTGSRAGAEIGS